MLAAAITVQAAGQVDPAIFELPGDTADPGMTLRPLYYNEGKLGDWDLGGCVCRRRPISDGSA